MVTYRFINLMQRLPREKLSTLVYTTNPVSTIKTITDLLQNMDYLIQEIMDYSIRLTSKLLISDKDFKGHLSAPLLTTKFLGESNLIKMKMTPPYIPNKSYRNLQFTFNSPWELRFNSKRGDESSNFTTLRKIHIGRSPLNITLFIK